MRRSGRKARRGFTLVEMMIVVAIAGVLMALALSGWRRAGVKRDIHSAMSDIESAVRTARNLAMLAGGAVGTPAFANCFVINGAGGAPAGSPEHLAIFVDAGNLRVTVPVELQDDGAGGLRTVCNTIDLSGFASDGLVAELVAATNPAGALTLAFSQTGRAYTPPLAPAVIPQGWNIGLRTTTGEAMLEEGIQILPSGVLCRRKITGLPVNAAIACDQT